LGNEAGGARQAEPIYLQISCCTMEMLPPASALGGGCRSMGSKSQISGTLGRNLVDMAWSVWHGSLRTAVLLMEFALVVGFFFYQRIL